MLTSSGALNTRIKLKNSFFGTIKLSKESVEASSGFNVNTSEKSDEENISTSSLGTILEKVTNNKRSLFA